MYISHVYYHGMMFKLDMRLAAQRVIEMVVQGNGDGRLIQLG